jgi:uncharacterized membrane protein YcaP (DUF421 family)
MHSIAANMFLVPVPILEKILRPILVYIVMLVLLRIFGKRELAQLNPFDLVVLLLLANTVQNAAIGEDNSVSGGVIGAAALLLFNYVVVRFVFGHRRLDQLLEGKPSTLVRDGNIQKDQLARELITVAELEVMARRQGFDGIHEIENCVLEPGGAVVMKRKVPSTDDRHHHELLARLDALAQHVARLEARLAAPPPA